MRVSGAKERARSGRARPGADKQGLGGARRRSRRVGTCPSGRRTAAGSTPHTSAPRPGPAQRTLRTKRAPCRRYSRTTAREHAVHWLKACPARHICEKPPSWPRIMCGGCPSGSSSWVAAAAVGAPEPVDTPPPGAGAAAPSGCASTAAINSTARLPAMALSPGRATCRGMAGSAADCR